MRVSYPFCAPTASPRRPLLLRQKDFNVPCHGAEQMYQALRSLDVPTQLILYPSQNHEMTVPSYLSIACALLSSGTTAS